MNKRVLITAGPTHELIDPVRFIGNYSSGKMGYALAEVFAAAGAEVHLVSGPVDLETRHPGIITTRVTSASEMYEACKGVIVKMDIAIFSAAVADFAPVEPEVKKIKSGERILNIALKPTPDIAGELGKQKRGDQLFVGFALETNNELENASYKIKKKNFDLIVLNSLNDTGAGFGGDTNRVSIIDREGNVEKFELKPKNEVAGDIYVRIEKMIHNA